MVVVRKAYCDAYVFGSSKTDSISIVEPGQSLPMNKLIKGVINGTIVINPRQYDYDFKESWSDEFDAKGTPAEIAAQQNNAFIDALDAQSDIPADPTASPNFDAVDAENLAQELASAQATIEGGGAAVGEGSALSQQAGDAEPVTQPGGSLSSGVAGAND